MYPPVLPPTFKTLSTIYVSSVWINAFRAIEPPALDAKLAFRLLEDARISRAVLKLIAPSQLLITALDAMSLLILLVEGCARATLAIGKSPVIAQMCWVVWLPTKSTAPPFVSDVI